MCDFFCIFAANFNKSDMKKLLILACAAFALLACNQQPASMENQTIQTIMSRVSVREFTGEKISEAQIDTLLRAAMAAPSAINKQPWAFIVVTDEAKIAQLGDSLPNSRCANHPAVAIIPCGDLSKAIEGEMAAFWINDVSAATENLLLAAHSMGLGAVWTGLHPDMNRAKMVQQLLGLPEHIIPLCVVPVGVPAEQPEVKDKYKPENIHYNAW
jgi:nitroreductase